jgi:uncharacterized protein (TIGR00106 family)
MIMAELSMFPVDKGESLSGYIAKILEVIDGSGISYRLNPMGTVLEGDWDEVMAVVKKCHQALEEECNRIYTTIKVDYRKGTKGRMEAKIKAVEGRIGKTLKK